MCIGKETYLGVVSGVHVCKLYKSHGVSGKRIERSDGCESLS